MNEINYINPIFMGYYELVLDSFWKDMFEKMAKNIFPKNITFSVNESDEGKLIKTYVTSDDVETKPSKEIDITNTPKDNLNLVIHFLEKYGRLKSPYLFYPKKNKNDISSEWKKVPKNKKQRLIISFLVKIKEKKQLTPEEYKNLKAVINYGFTYKCLTNDDITYRRNKIINIKGIFFNKKTRTFRTRPIKLINIKNKPPICPSDALFSQISTYINSTNNKYKLFPKI